MDDHELKEVMKGQVELAKKQGLKIVALQCICGALLAEIAGLADDPSLKLGQMTAGLEGVAQTIAERGVDDPALRLAIEEVCSIAAEAIE